MYGLTTDERLHLEALSLEVFGVKSKWKKILDKGERVDKTFIVSGQEFKGHEVNYVTVETIKNVLEERVKAKQAKKEADSASTNATPDGSSDNSGSNPVSQDTTGSV
jgi:hypothetical protein